MITQRTDQPLMQDRAAITQTIANFWNKTTEGWRTIWGPHIHHGYYENDTTLTPLEAQEKLIAKLVEALQLSPHAHILDVGCGMGGSSIYLAKHHQATVTGITLSHKQMAIAMRDAALLNVKNVAFKIEDALALPSLQANSFDVIWSLESCEQFFDKGLFLQQAYRTLKPGGKLMLATWCSDQAVYSEQLATAYRKLCIAFDLPYMPTIDHYQTLLARSGFTLEKTFDWSDKVEQSWEIGMTLANAFSFLQLIKLGGLRGLRFVKQTKMMRDAFKQKRVRYGVFIATKPLA